MKEFDELFTKPNEEIKTDDKRPFDKDAWAEKKKQERAEAYALLDEATKEAAEDPEKFRDYLNVQARFDRYSVSNALLISHQKYDATKLCDYMTWNKEGVNVEKGEKSILILEPGNEYTRDDGSKAFSVNTKRVFDISQTTAKDKQRKPKTPDPRSAIKALIEAAPCPIVMDNEVTKNVLAVYSPDKSTIYIRQGMDANDIFKSLSQEVVIARYAGKDYDRKDCAFFAYCASFILCERNGFDTGDFNFDRVPERYDGTDLKKIRSDMTNIRDMTNDVTRDMIRQFEAMEKTKQLRDKGAR